MIVSTVHSVCLSRAGYFPTLLTTGPHDFIVGRPSRGRPTMLTPELREELCAHLAQGAPIKTACQALAVLAVHRKGHRRAHAGIVGED